MREQEVMTVRKLLKCLLLVLLVSLFCADTVKTIHADNDYQIIIDDKEDLLSNEEEALLREKMAEITAYGNCAFVTVSQYDDTSTYAKNLYRSYFGTESGMLFVIDMGRRNIWIFCDGAIYRTIDKAYANTITDNVYLYARNGQYYSCAYNAFDQASILLEGGRIAQPMKYISNILIACVLALLVNFFLLTARRNNDEDIVYTAVPALSLIVGADIVSKKLVSTRKTRYVESSDSSGYSGGGGGGFSGGGGGGGSSGGGGGHSF